MTTTAASGVVFTEPTKLRSKAQFVAWYEIDTDRCSASGKRDHSVLSRMAFCRRGQDYGFAARPMIPKEDRQCTGDCICPIRRCLKRHHIEEGVDGLQTIRDGWLATDIDDVMVWPAVIESGSVCEKSRR